MTERADAYAAPRVAAYGERDHELDGYGGTWLRRWRLSVLLGPFIVGGRFSVSRVRAVRPHSEQLHGRSIR